VALLVVLAVTAVLGGGWYYADRIMARPHADAVPRATVVAIDRTGTAATVRLRGPALAGQPEVVGLRTPDGYLQLDPPSQPASSVGGQTEASRRARLLSGTWPAAGAIGEVDTDAFPAEDPAVAVAGALTQVTIAGPLGPYPAWQVSGANSTWIVYVHGRGATRAEGLRLLSVTSRLGYPALDITYRNDQDAPTSPDRRNHWGLTEWADLQAAVDYLKAKGVRRVVLAGSSMGGAIVATFLRRSPDAGLVAGTILDAPVLSIQRVLRHEASTRGLSGAPGAVLLPVAKAIADWRGDIDFAALEQPPATLRTPMLLIHGTADGSVPVEGSDAYAAARPDLVTYLRVPGAGQVESWNVSRGQYESAVSRFMTDRAR
jgi:pimeloyl-ACP methyl ester carboxylesterase